MRRAFDIVVSSVVLMSTLPILLIAAVAIKLDSAGPVISRHSRVGRDGAPFELLRLRSTVHETVGERSRDGENLSVVTERSAGITRVGRILRGTSIDELPQLWNVLRGDMTLVGPRPEAPAGAPSGSSAGTSDRVRLVPGLTGTWSSADNSEFDRAAGHRVDRDGSTEQGEPDFQVG